MKRTPHFLAALFWLAPLHAAEDTVILDETGVRNLGIETVSAEEAVFESTLLTLGRIEAIPRKTGVVSGRIAGRLVGLSASPGDSVAAGDEVAKVESRQPGDPPPLVSLLAPIGGMVTRVEVRLGDPVDPERALIEITDLSEVHVVAAVPEYQAGFLKPGARARVLVPAVGREPFEGELLRFAPSADRETGTIGAVLLLANPGERMRPGMIAECSLVLSQRENVLSVPREAVQGTGASRFVFVKHFDLPNAFVKAPVEIGERNEDRVEILGGLFPADDVVTRGAYALAHAGPGSVSLKEAMDAAHGHAHNEDGSEIGEGRDDRGHDHGDETEEGSLDRLTLFLAIACGVLLLLLLASPFLHRRRAAAPESPC